MEYIQYMGNVIYHSKNSCLQQICLNRSPWFTGSCLALIYFLMAKLGLNFTTVADSITLIWPPSGLSLFALLILGKRYWPWIALAAFITNLSTGISVYACLGIAFGNTLEALFGYYLLNRFSFDNQLTHIRDVLYLALFAAGLSTMVSATIGTLSLISFGIIPISAFSSAWLIWWMGDSMGILAFTPLLLSWWHSYPKKITKSLFLELSVLLVGTIVITEIVFGLQDIIFDQPLPLAYMTFPFLIWAAMRFSLRGTTTISFIIGGIILLNIVFNEGLFKTISSFESLVLLWLYTNFLAVTSMILTTAIEERQEVERKMRYRAEHDELTHLPNRRELVDRISHAIDHANRNNNKFALLFLDIDRFKIINDSLGHFNGDKLLTAVSQLLLQSVRKEDTVSRLGGDEFVILIENVQAIDAVSKIIRNILNSIRKPMLINGSELHNSVSIGVCIYPNDGNDPEILLKHADIAMYRVKDSGRDNYQFYTPDMNVFAEERLSLENDLRQALKNNEFSLHYQPQFEVDSGLIKGCEALLRWYKDGEVHAGPDLFIPVLEETGQIKKVGAWVIENACKQLSVWDETGWNELRMSVNVSSQQLEDSKFPKIVAGNLKKYNIKPERFEIEITESLMVRQDEIVENVIQDIIAIGVHLAIDDFGTGYSSLSYLHRLSIDTLKVDRSFIDNIPGNTNSETIAKAIIALGKSLQLTIVAEGIENSKQCDFISNLGCDLIQGFLFSKPLTPELFSHLLETNRLTPVKVG